jgi:5-methylcytosine-specific restriction endonuclease McrA
MLKVLRQGRRRARQQGLPFELIPVDEILKRKRVCGICGKRIQGRFEIDHIIPLAMSGSHTKTNLQLAHSACNRRKRKKDRAL